MKKKIGRASKLTLDERIFVRRRGESERELHNRIIGQIRLFDSSSRLDLIRKIALHKALPQTFMPVYPGGRGFHEAPVLSREISTEGYCSWLLAQFERYSAMLSAFCVIRRRLNAKLLNGEAQAALDCLEEVRGFCESWWGIETAIHIKKELLDMDVRPEIKRIEANFPNLKVSGFTSDLVLLSESGAAELYVETICSRLKEYKSSNVPDAILNSGMESLFALPIAFDHARVQSLAAFENYGAWSLIDQYILFVGVIQGLRNQGDLKLEFLHQISSLAEAIGDVELDNILKENDDPPSHFVSEVIDKYTYGEYSEVVTAIHVELDNYSGNIFGLAEVYARSIIYIGREFPATPFGKIASAMAGLLMLDPGSAEKKRHLINMCVKFRRELWAKSVLYHVLLLHKTSSDPYIIEVMREELRGLGSLNTPKVLSETPALSTMGSNREVPSYRAIKYDPGCHPELDSSQFPIRTDYIHVVSAELESKGDISAAVDFCLAEYWRNPVSFSFLPIESLCKVISDRGSQGEYGFLRSLALLDVFSRERGGAFEDVKASLFQDFIYAQPIFQPSKMFDSKSLNALTGYFLKDICVPAQLDGIVDFSSNDDVIHERVSIIDFLLKSDFGAVEELRAERDRVLETLFSEKLRAKIETGKLYVDVQALLAHRRHVYEGLYAQAKAFGGGLELEEIGQDSSVDSKDILALTKPIRSMGTAESAPTDGVILALASSEKSNILLSIFGQAARDFALSESYGLDKYLSAEVRHIVFTAQLRACFERRGLVTVKKNGVYEQNSFWIERYNYVAAPIVCEVDRCLARFAEALDDLLKKVNDQFRVNVSDMNSKSVFNFLALHERLVAVSRVVMYSRDFDEFFEGLISLMWDIATEGSVAAQALINDDLLIAVEQEVDALEHEVGVAKGGVAMIELMHEIRSARTDFKKEVELVLNWFRPGATDDGASFEKLAVVVEAAVSAFQSAFRHKGRTLELDVSKGDLLLSYGEARSLFISLFTALENALKYGDPSDPVVIVCKEDGVNTRLDVINRIYPMSASDADTFISEVRRKWTDAYSKLSTAEGGTGLYKIYNLLSMSSPGFKFDIESPRVL